MILFCFIIIVALALQEYGMQEPALKTMLEFAKMLKLEKKLLEGDKMLKLEKKKLR